MISIKSRLKQIKEGGQYAVSEEFYPNTYKYIQEMDTLKVFPLMNRVKYDLILRIFDQAKIMRESLESFVDYYELKQNKNIIFQDYLFEINEMFKIIFDVIKQEDNVYYKYLTTLDLIDNNTKKEEYLEKYKFLLEI